MPATRLMFIEDREPMAPALQDELEERGYPSVWVSSYADEDVGLAFAPDVLVLGECDDAASYPRIFKKLAQYPAATSLIVARQEDADELHEIRQQAHSHFVPMLGMLNRPLAMSKITGLLHNAAPPGNTRVGGDVALINALIGKSRLIPNLTVEFQSKHDLKTGATVGYEALTRLKIRRALDPSIIFSQLVDLEVERAASLVVLDQAVAVAKRLQGSAHPVPIAFNCSVAVLASDDFVDQILASARYYGIAPHWLNVEITEDARMTDQPTIIAALHRLRAAGVTVAIDDFGTGMSNLDRIAQWPFDEIKIDKSIFWACCNGDLPASFVTSILDLCKARRCRSVIEGIENDFHLAKAKLFNADIGQGFYWGKAVPPNIFAPVAKQKGAGLG